MRSITIICMCGVLSQGGTALSATIHVPGDQPTIQAGIDAALESDTVLVAPGVYTGDGNRDLDFSGVNLVLMSSDGPEATIIDCQGFAVDPHRGLVFQTGENASSVLSGFTIQSGRGPEMPGGGYFASSIGGAIVMRGASPTIENCWLLENRANAGGAIACVDGSSPIFVECTIISNTAFRIPHSEYPYSDPAYGGGAYCDQSSVISLERSTMCFNQSTDGGYYPDNLGHAIAGGRVIMNQCIIAFNGYINYGYTQAGLIECDSAWLSCTNVFSNGPGDWIGVIASQADSNGNFSADPQFCDHNNGDFALSASSPCLPVNNSCGELVGALGEGCTVTDVSEIGNDQSIPLNFTLNQNYPNPFNPGTTIRYSLTSRSEVLIEVFDLLGRRVATLVNTDQAAGEHRVAWDGRNDNGEQAATGVYFYRLSTYDQTLTRKMIILK